MEKKTVLAIVLSMLVMFGYFYIQSVINPPPEPGTAPAKQTPQTSTGTSSQTGAAPAPALSNDSPPPASVEMVPSVSDQTFAAPESVDEFVPLETVTVDTDMLTATLTNMGGDITSFRLKKHKDGNDPVEMILAGSTKPRAFSIAFGNWEDVLARKVKVVDRNFRVKRVSDYIVEFSQNFATASGGYFTLVKRYEFKPGEYMFELTVALNGGNSVNSFNFDNAAYTLFFGPQIGPKFNKLDQRYEFRHYLTYNKGKMRTEKVNEKAPTVVDSSPTWAAIAGKYFTLIALPYVSQYELAFSAQPENGVPSTSELFITRPAFGGSRVEDKYQFYLGPKNQESLSIYERGDNGFKLRDTGLLDVADTKGFLAPLEKALKWLLMLFHSAIPNYGVAIILLTLLVKVITFPLTKKGSEATLRMQALSPKIKELQEKYKDNKTKLNAEMAEFYKKEGYNPLSGCLPMLIQLPIFFAMYNLFNNHFDLRGAMFIPGWIPDLSIPEAVYNFPNNFKLPFLGWTALRLLPFIYVGSQLLYGKVTQTPDQKGNAQMKMMLYLMPIVFFFILYDVPSGLLLYWIMSNILTMVQQVGINKYMARKKAAMAAAQGPARPVIAPPTLPPKKRKRK